MSLHAIHRTPSETHSPAVAPPLNIKLITKHNINLMDLIIRGLRDAHKQDLVECILGFCLFLLRMLIILVLIDCLTDRIPSLMNVIQRVLTNIDRNFRPQNNDELMVTASGVDLVDWISGQSAAEDLVELDQEFDSPLYGIQNFSLNSLGENEAQSGAVYESASQKLQQELEREIELSETIIVAPNNDFRQSSWTSSNSDSGSIPPNWHSPAASNSGLRGCYHFLVEKSRFCNMKATKVGFRGQRWCWMHAPVRVWSPIRYDSSHVIRFPSSPLDGRGMR